ncbi:hypothetical protein BofuT4_P063090.1 [Botrytis cinerea T4]|uniref:Uncharacterized protein n=1 Tax=Botryotinia fuckeliana (strain T4) TaxID=999810 RepID=G2XTP3_BOTF4|nr:hypothetical protein BofuT4_P063090.1 [Botrytis cinerea T4]
MERSLSGASRVMSPFCLAPTNYYFFRPSTPFPIAIQLPSTILSGPHGCVHSQPGVKRWRQGWGKFGTDLQVLEHMIALLDNFPIAPRRTQTSSMGTRAV